LSETNNSIPLSRDVPEPEWLPEVLATPALTPADPPRMHTRPVSVGGVKIGGGAPVVVQSMCTTMTWDVAATMNQIQRLADAGCEVVRVAVPDDKSADALPEIVKRSPIPVVADIHFHYKLGLKALAAGVHKIRINPGNIGSEDKTREILAAARDRGVPIRVGANVGSLPKSIIAQYGSFGLILAMATWMVAMAGALVLSASVGALITQTPTWRTVAVRAGLPGATR